MSKPVYYSQKDKRWGSKDYSAPGERTTIARSGCGPTCAAMAISTITGDSVTPDVTCAWAKAHGYKAKGQGTYYSYFAPQLAEYGIQCRRINSVSLYGKVNAIEHEQMRDELDKGNLVIACMGKGLWTSSGHFILLYGEEEGGKLLINDPASAAYERSHGAPSQFYRQAKYYFVINKKGGKMTMTTQEAKETIMAKAHLAPKTMEFLEAYKYSDDLLKKLAGAMK